MGDPGSDAFKQVVERILDFLKEHIGYMISCNKHVKDMRDQMTGLDNIKCVVEEHKNHNTERRLELPGYVNRWLEEVRETDEKVKNVATDVGTCFPIYRHKLAMKALEIIKDIKRVKEQQSLIVWNDLPIPLGRVDTMMASTFTPSSDHHNGFASRYHVFKKALKALRSDNASQMIALCGMGGVGKTTIMEELRKVVAGEKVFDYIVKVVVGEKPDLIAIQQTVAHYLGIELRESTKSENVDKLHTGLKTKASVGMIKLLIIMDDVWHSVDLEDIGLSPPVQDVHFKVLLTSRNKDVCTKMGVEPNNVLNVGLLEEEEARHFFRQFLYTCDDADPHLHKIGEDIVRKCGGLPIAIKTMACALRGQRNDTWKDALVRLEHHDNDDVVKKVFQLSYNNLQDAETKSVFLMCGLYPEDFDIPTEELVRYGWGLKTFKHVSSVTEARIRLNTCIGKLINANMLLKSDDAHGCVKMHDLVLAFVLNMFSEKEHASIVRHGSMSGWPEDHISDSSWKNISLTCRGMSEFPTDIKFPNLLFLKLMHGDKSLKFPQDFYGEMEKLQVISYDNMICPLLQTSPQCSTNLRVLHLHKCSLKFDCSFIGNLLNLEVLSFAHSLIERLPSTIGNLKKLRLLDLTNCFGLRVDNGVLKNLVKLEEIYAIAEHRYGYRKNDDISFTSDDWHEMAKRSKNLLALEFEFFENNAPLKNMSFEKLERFKISVGSSKIRSCNECKHSFQNTLELVTSKDEILETKIYELFKETEELCLSVDGINYVEDIVMKPLHPFRFSSFDNLRNLVVWRCADLEYLFTPGAAKALPTLEHLQVYKCDNMKALIHTEGGGVETIRFLKLKFLSLKWLPKLSCLCDDVSILELPQLESLNLEGLTEFTSIFSQNKLDKCSFFSEEAVIPKLEVLYIEQMENLKEIWPCDFSVREEVKLRRIKVSDCHNLVNLFPRNAMPLLHHLEELQLWSCDSIKVLFNMDLNCLDKIGEGSSSSIRKIEVFRCRSLVNLFPRNAMPLLHHLEELRVENCDSIKVLFNMDLNCLDKIGEGSSSIRNIEVSYCRSLVNIFPCNPMPLLHHLEELRVENCDSIKVLFNMDLNCLDKIREGSSSIRNIEVSYCRSLVNIFPCNPMPLLHHLEELRVENCDSIKVLFNMDLNCLDKIREGSSSIRNIEVSYCRSLVNIFPCNPMPLLHHLEELHLSHCDSIKVLFEIDLDSLGETGEVNNSSLRSIKVNKLCNLRQVWRIKGESNSRLLIPSFKAIESIEITNCLRFTHLWTPTNISFDLGALLNLKLKNNVPRLIDNLEEEKREEEEIDIVSKKEASQVVDIKSNIAFPSFVTHSFHNLRTLVLEAYECMEVVFEIESSTSGELATTHHNQRRLLPYLEELEISEMRSMSHVWKCNWNKYLILQKQPSESPFHNLTTIKLKECQSIKYLFSPLMAKLLSNLRKVDLEECRNIEEVVSNRDDEDEEVTTFTSTSTHTSTTFFPHLDSLTLYWLNHLKCIGGGGAKVGNNKLSFNDTTTTTRLDQFKFPQVGGVSWSLCQYAREINISSCDKLSSVIPCYAAGQRQKLQVLIIKACYEMKEIFETQWMNNNNKSGFDEGNSGTPGISRLNNVIMLPNLKILNISHCHRLEHVFTFSTLDSLRQLEELTIEWCDKMKVTVKEEDDKEQTTTASSKEVVHFPHLKSIELKDLPELEGFFLGKNEFMWSSLDKVTIKKCPKMTVFAPGGSTTPLLKYVHTDFGKYSLEECGLNFHVTTAARNQTPFPSSCPATSVRMPWSSHNLIELHMSNNDVCEKIITSNELLQLQKLEKIDVSFCYLVQEVFEALEGGTNSSGFDQESQTTLLKLPNLRQVNLKWLNSLRHIWKSNQWTAFEFPNLTTVTIDYCGSLKRVFTSSMAGSLLQLQELHITWCDQLEEVFGKDTNVAVEEEEKESHGKMNEIIMFPHLKSLSLGRLSRLKGFCLGKEDFSFPLLDTLRIDDCPAITTFTNGNSATPELKAIKIDFKPLDAAGEDINSIIKRSIKRISEEEEDTEEEDTDE